jgi:hypothetical protein
LVALLAGIAASIITAGFHALASEPVIERAIALEESMAAAHGHGEEAPVVAREVQRLGLWLGWLGIGITYATIAGAAYFLAWPRIVAASSWRWRAVIGAAGGWALGVFPLLRFPANPPAVGDPATIGQRTSDFLLLEALSVVLIVIAVALWHIERRRRPGLALALAVGGWVLGSTALYAFIPQAPAPEVPAGAIEIVAQFRVLAVVGQALFWTVFAIAFAALPGWRPLALDGGEAHSTRPARAGVR